MERKEWCDDTVELCCHIKVKMDDLERGMRVRGRKGERQEREGNRFMLI